MFLVSLAYPFYFRLSIPVPIKGLPKGSEQNGAGVGWFKGPSTLPLIPVHLSDKKLTEGRDVSRVYLELLARHMDGGVVEIGNEADHAIGDGHIVFDCQGAERWRYTVTHLLNIGLAFFGASARNRLE